MNDHPNPPATPPEPGPESISLRDLTARYPAWQIEVSAVLHVWTALKSADTSTRFLVAYDAAQLLAKLEAAEAGS